MNWSVLSHDKIISSRTEYGNVMDATLESNLQMAWSTALLKMARRGTFQQPK